MIDSIKAVFLPIDDRILNLFKGYVLNGEPLLNVKETDVYTVNEYFEFSDSISKVERIIRIVVFIPFVPIFILILLIAAIFKKFDQVGDKITYVINEFFSLFFKKKKEKRTAKIKNKQYENVAEDDIPEFLNHCKKHFVKVYLYSYRELTNDEKEKIENLIKLGLLSSSLVISKLSDLVPFIETERVSLRNSLLVITNLNETGEANLLGFYSDNGHKRNVELWKKRRLRSEGGKSELEWNSHETIIGLKRKIEHYLTAKNNTFFSNDCILFIEDTQDVFLNSYMQKNLTAINSRLSKKGMKLLYFPDFKIKVDILPQSIFNFLRYRIPVLYSLTDTELKEATQAILSKLTPEDFYKLLLEELELPYFRRPCLLRNISGGLPETKNKFTYTYIQYLTEKDLERLFDRYINHVRIPDDNEGVMYSLAPFDKLIKKSDSEYDADYHFSNDVKENTEELKLKIDELKIEGKFGVLAEAIMYMLETIKDEKPEILKKIKPIIEQKKLLESKVVLSPILIDKYYNIFLPDFGNIEVKMHALPKTVYLFFLRYPNGVRFKELYQHKDELLEIYNKITNKYDNQEIEKTINDLVDMTKPSINQKCARIREAFRKLMDENIAQHYYIDGLNGEPKKISLPQNLIDIRY